MKDAVLVNNVSSVVAEDREGQRVLLDKRLVRPRIVYVDANNLCIEFVEFGKAVSQRTHLSGADAGERAWEKGEHCRAFRS